jgi:pterin-4a-carbinolamine dehydratase
MKNIFISYRRSDTSDTVHRMALALNEFGENNIFFDRDSAPPGTQWPDLIRNAIEEADALLVVIGQKWLHIQDTRSGRRRIDIEDDWVRQEILTFIGRKQTKKNLIILPLLVNGADMPRPEFLDDDLKQLCDYQPLRIGNNGSNLDFVQVKQRLIENRFRPITPPAVVTPVSGQKPLQLTEQEEEDFLKEYTNWSIIEQDKPGASGDVMRELYRLYEFTDYAVAWKFMSQVDELGIRPYHHHPRWQNSYNRIEIWLSTFNVGHKPTKKDIRLAKIMESTWNEIKDDK